MRSISCFLLFIFIILLHDGIIASRAEVITLTPDTFTDKVKEKDTAWFVKFCVPWCKHCKNLGSLWEDLGAAMEGEDEIEIGQVDCSTSKPVCTQVDIHSYPTFKLFYDGEEVAKYQDDYMSHIFKQYKLDSDSYGSKCGIEAQSMRHKPSSGPRDIESLKAFALNEAEKAASKAQLDKDGEL